MEGELRAPARQCELSGRWYVIIGDSPLHFFENVRVGTLILKLPLQPHDWPRPRGHRRTGVIAMVEAAQAHGLSVESDGRHPPPVGAASL